MPNPEMQKPYDRIRENTEPKRDIHELRNEEAARIEEERKREFLERTAEENKPGTD